MDFILQKGTLQLLLITVLATAATAIYVYNPKFVKEHNAYFRKLPVIKVTTGNANVNVTWKFVDEYIPGLRFEVVNEGNSNGNKKCNGGPTFDIHNGYIYCLHQMSFCSQNIDGQERLELQLVIKNRKFDSDQITVHLEVFEKPEAELLPRITHVKPFTEDQLNSAHVKKNFEGPTSWVKDIMDKGVYSAKYEEMKKIVHILVAHPIVIDAGILNNILKLESLKMSETKVESSGKNLINMWNGSGKPKK